MARTRDSGKWVFVFIAILVIIAVVVSGILTDWYIEGNKFCLFGHTYGEDNKCIRCGAEKPAEDKPEPPAVVDDKGNALASDKVYQMPKGLVFASATSLYSSEPATANDTKTSYASVTLEITIEPDNEYTQMLQYEWSVEFANPDSDWAQGKYVDDYITLNPNIGNSWRRCQVTCVEGFGEQIVLTVQSPVNEVSKSCTIDYEKPVVACGLEVVEVGNTSNKPLIVHANGTCTGSLPLNTLATEDKLYNIVLTPEYGVGTVATEELRVLPFCSMAQCYEQGDFEEIDLTKPIAFNKDFVEKYSVSYSYYIDQLKAVALEFGFAIIGHKYGEISFSDYENITGTYFDNIPVDKQNCELAPKSIEINETEVLFK